MIFATAADEPAVFLMLSEDDVVQMREGRTKFVDRRATGGATFKKVILSLHKTNDEAIALLRKYGHARGEPVTHEPLAGEGQCVSCKGIMAPASLFEGKCIVCWAMEAKKGGGA
jgi:hypothetical protein